jgi:hypothetical protein
VRRAGWVEGPARRDPSDPGLVFASALDNDQTAYALTAQEISQDAQAGRATNRTVSTQGRSV